MPSALKTSMLTSSGVSKPSSTRQRPLPRSVTKENGPDVGAGVASGPMHPRSVQSAKRATSPAARPSTMTSTWLLHPMAVHAVNGIPGRHPEPPNATNAANTTAPSTRWLRVGRRFTIGISAPRQLRDLLRNRRGQRHDAAAGAGADAAREPAAFTVHVILHATTMPREGLPNELQMESLPRRCQSVSEPRGRCPNVRRRSSVGSIAVRVTQAAAVPESMVSDADNVRARAHAQRLTTDRPTPS